MWTDVAYFVATLATAIAVSLGVGASDSTPQVAPSSGTSSMSRAASPASPVIPLLLPNRCSLLPRRAG
jgi:hypothetical protein